MYERITCLISEERVCPEFGVSLWVIDSAAGVIPTTILLGCGKDRKGKNAVYGSNPKTLELGALFPHGGGSMTWAQI